MVGDILAAVEGVLARPGGAGFPGFDAADRRHCGHGSGRLHSLDGAIRGQALSRWRSGMAKAACSRSGLSPHGVFALSPFSRCSGKWSSTNEGRTIRSGRTDFTWHGGGKILLYFGDTCRRHSARPRRSGGSSRGRDRFSAWQKTRVAPGEVKGARARRGGSRSRSGIQYAARSSAVFARGSGRRFTRAGAWLGSASVGNLLGDAAFAAGKCSAVPGAAVSIGSSGGIWNLRGTRSCRRLRLGGVYEAPALDAGALSAISEKDFVVPTRSGRTDGGNDGLVCAATPRRWIQTRG